MRELTTKLSGPRLFELDRFGDERGTFMEAWHDDRLRGAGHHRPLGPGQPLDLAPWCACAGFTSRWIRDRRSSSAWRWAAPSMWSSTSGALPADSGVGRLSSSCAEAPRVLYVPPGFAHGFCALEDDTHLLYKVSALLRSRPASVELAWDDPDVGVDVAGRATRCSPRGIGLLPALRELEASGDLP